MQAECPQCGAPVPVGVEARSLDCQHCDSTLWLDKDKLFFHYLVPPRLDAVHAEGAVRRWMSGELTPRRLARTVRFEPARMALHPVWRIAFETKGRRIVRQTPAAADAPAELQNLMVPAGALAFFDPALTPGFTVIPPGLSAQAAQERMAKQLDVLAGKGQELTIARAVLVHVPVFALAYHYRGQRYDAFVDAASGAVRAGRYPQKPELPFVLTALVCFWTLVAAGSQVSNDGLRALVLAGVAAGLAAMASVTSSRV